MDDRRLFRLMPGDTLPNGYQVVGVIAPGNTSYTFRHPDHCCDVTMVEGTPILKEFEEQQ